MHIYHSAVVHTQMFSGMACQVVHDQSLDLPGKKRS